MFLLRMLRGRCTIDTRTGALRNLVEGAGKGRQLDVDEVHVGDAQNEIALKHDAVVHHAVDNVDQRRVFEHRIGGETKRRFRSFARLRGHEEWGVRITALAAPKPEKGEGGSMVGRRPAAASGREYLKVKKRLRMEAPTPPRAVVKELNAVLKALSRLASQTRADKFPPPAKGRPYVTGASFLVKTQRRAQWKKQAVRLADSIEKHGHRVEITGPWPPYHFVSR